MTAKNHLSDSDIARLIVDFHNGVAKLKILKMLRISPASLEEYIQRLRNMGLISPAKRDRAVSGTISKSSSKRNLAQAEFRRISKPVVIPTAVGLPKSPDAYARPDDRYLAALWHSGRSFAGDTYTPTGEHPALRRKRKVAA